MTNVLTIDQSALDGIAVLKLSGYLDGHTFQDFDRSLTELIQAGAKRLVVDLSGLLYIASAGVGAFINANHQLKKLDGTLQLFNASASVREIFNILGLDSIFTIHDSLPAALRAAQA